MDGKGIFLIAEIEFPALIQSLVKNHSSLIFLASGQRMVEENQTTEECFYMLLRLTFHLSINDIDAILTTHYQFTFLGQEGSTIIEMSVLQSVHIIIAGHVYFPFSTIILG